MSNLKQRLNPQNVIFSYSAIISVRSDFEKLISCKTVNVDAARFHRLDKMKRRQNVKVTLN